MPSVAIVTASTGRATLQKTLDSVAAQTHPCQHYVIFDGPLSGDARNDVKLPRQVETIFIPKRTGANGIMNGCILAAAPFLITEDYLCYLDDDNWFDDDHVESLVNVIEDKAYAYSLRNIVEPDGTFFARDDGEAIGHHGNLVDANCFMFRREVAQGVASLWPRNNGTNCIGDRYVWDLLKTHNTPWAATGKYTVNYRMGGQCGTQRGFFFLNNAIRRSQYPDGFPWAETPAILSHGL